MIHTFRLSFGEGQMKLPMDWRKFVAQELRNVADSIENTDSQHGRILWGHEGHVQVGSWDFDEGCT